ncbi:MAG: type II toxin-antitoxin system HigB family toxin [Chloroflexi bacterium]|nr:type II toxin-antitoxin system HigB family toxin [Chloroflexota bacterium]MYD49752.1 type II toxin-antitoxin system HigB family toxin [Chloroflexota bacterium]
MRIIAKRTIREFWESHPDAESALREWYVEVAREDWSTPAELIRRYPGSSIVGSDRAVFRIRGNNYRLVVRIFYPARTVYIRFVGTHAQYNRINAEEV